MQNGELFLFPQRYAGRFFAGYARKDTRGGILRDMRGIFVVAFILRLCYTVIATQTELSLYRGTNRHFVSLFSDIAEFVLQQSEIQVQGRVFG